MLVTRTSGLRIDFLKGGSRAAALFFAVLLGKSGNRINLTLVIGCAGDDYSPD